ncbi:MAG: hypothetical protein WA840_07230 [Caulobacteraceae bacterium]
MKPSLSAFTLLIIILVVGGMVGAAPGLAAPTRQEAARHRRDIVGVLQQVSSAGGGSVWARIQACGFKIDWGASSVTRLDSPNPSLGLDAGDATVFVAFDQPWLHRPAWMTDVAFWSIRRGVVAPISHAGWDRALQRSKSAIRLQNGRSC